MRKQNKMVSNGEKTEAERMEKQEPSSEVGRQPELVCTSNTHTDTHTTNENNV